MEYDIEIMVLVCSKFLDRFNDFKKHGLVNIKNRKILLNLITSNDLIEESEVGWHPNIDVKIKNYNNSNYVGNFYKFYLDYELEKINSRWLMRIDDDSCTDIDNLVSNLDMFYDSESIVYMGDLAKFCEPFGCLEGQPFFNYKKYLDEYEKIALNIKNEIECGIVSMPALKKVLTNERSRRLLQKRSELEGGYTDCVFALSAALAKVYAFDCPFITHNPSVLDFSLLGGVYNHIHALRRNEGEGENFYSGPSFSYKLLIKSIEKELTEKEQKISGSKYLLELESHLDVFNFNPNFSVHSKWDDNLWGWYEENDCILIVTNDEIKYKLILQQNGDLIGTCDENFVLKKIN